VRVPIFLQSFRHPETEAHRSVVQYVMAVSAPTSAYFLESYPEFSKAPADLVTRKLAEASRRTSANVFAPGSEQDDAVCLRAAVLLTLSPYSRKMKLVSDEQAFLWANQLFELQRAATMGIRVF
jgi:hypothetical protein